MASTVSFPSSIHRSRCQLRALDGQRGLERLSSSLAQFLAFWRLGIVERRPISDGEFARSLDTRIFWNPAEASLTQVYRALKAKKEIWRVSRSGVGFRLIPSIGMNWVSLQHLLNFGPLRYFGLAGAYQLSTRSTHLCSLRSLDPKIYCTSFDSKCHRDENRCFRWCLLDPTSRRRNGICYQLVRPGFNQVRS